MLSPKFQAVAEDIVTLPATMITHWARWSPASFRLSRDPAALPMDTWREPGLMAHAFNALVQIGFTGAGIALLGGTVPVLGAVAGVVVGLGAAYGLSAAMIGGISASKAIHKNLYPEVTGTRPDIMSEVLPRTSRLPSQP